MKFTFLSVNMNTLYITIFDLSRKKIQFVNVLLVIHIMWRTMESHTLGNELTESMVLNKKVSVSAAALLLTSPANSDIIR